MVAADFMANSGFVPAIKAASLSRGRSVSIKWAAKAAESVRASSAAREEGTGATVVVGISGVPVRR